jgi:hypothetical protein
MALTGGEQPWRAIAWRLLALPLVVGGLGWMGWRQPKQPPAPETRTS